MNINTVSTDAPIETGDTLAAGMKPAELPAGDTRRDALKAAYDELQKKSEEIAAELGLERPNPNVYKRVRDETVRPYDADLLIKHPDPAYTYSWVFRDPRGTTANRAVHTMEAKGWECVTGSHREAKGMKVNAENIVWNADCVLMRIRRDIHLVNEQNDWRKRRARESGIAQDLQALGDRLGVKVSEDVPDSVRGQIVQASAADMQSRAAKRGFARQMATQQFDNALRTGTIPGAPVGR